MVAGMVSAGHSHPRRAKAKAATLGAFSIQDSIEDDIPMTPVDVTKQAAFTQTSAKAPSSNGLPNETSDFVKGAEALLHDAEDDDDDKPDSSQKPVAQMIQTDKADQSMTQKYGADVASIIADVDKDSIGTIDPNPVQKVKDDSELQSIGGSNDDDPSADSSQSASDSGPSASLSADPEAEAEANDIEIRAKPASKVEASRSLTVSEREKLVDEQVASDLKAMHPDRKKLLSSAVDTNEIAKRRQAFKEAVDKLKKQAPPTAAPARALDEDRSASLEEPPAPKRWSPKLAFNHPVSHANSVEEWMDTSVSGAGAHEEVNSQADAPKPRLSNYRVLSSADHTPLMKTQTENIPWLRWKARKDSTSTASDSQEGDSDFGFSHLLRDEQKQNQGAKQKVEVADKPKNFWGSFYKRNAGFTSTMTTTSTATTTTTTHSLERDLGVEEATNPSDAAARWLAGAWMGKRQDVSTEAKNKDQTSTKPEVQFNSVAPSQLWDAHRMLLDAKEQYGESDESEHVESDENEHTEVQAKKLDGTSIGDW